MKKFAADSHTMTTIPWSSSPPTISSASIQLTPITSGSPTHSTLHSSTTHSLTQQSFSTTTLTTTITATSTTPPITLTPFEPQTPGYNRASLKYSKEQKLGHRRVGEDGLVTYKKKSTSELKWAIQLGIGQSVGGLSPKPRRDLLYGDFSVVETVFFPREGSNLTPAHRLSDFKFKTYAPLAFRYFRDIFNIPPEDFMLSLCNEPLKESSNPGASGSIFYISNDDEFIIKTVQKKEAEFLQKLLPGYFMNLNQNPRTLLPKFYGLYCYQCGGKNIRFVIMNNLLPSSIQMHCKFDLKGSTYKRKASTHELEKPHPTYKDLDFQDLYHDGLFLDSETHAALCRAISRDCRVLQSFQIMDYSMLIGLHNASSSTQKDNSHLIDQNSASVNLFGKGGGNAKIRMAQFSTALDSIQVPNQPTSSSACGGIPGCTGGGDDVLVFIGIIDILQSYRLSKKLEHTFKSMITDGDTISVHRPGFYAQRFQNFFSENVFKKIPLSVKLASVKRRSGEGRKGAQMVGDGVVCSEAEVAAAGSPNVSNQSESFIPSDSSPLPPYSLTDSAYNGVNPLQNPPSDLLGIEVHATDSQLQHKQQQQQQQQEKQQQQQQQQQRQQQHQQQQQQQRQQQQQEKQQQQQQEKQQQQQQQISQQQLTPTTSLIQQPKQASQQYDKEQLTAHQQRQEDDNLTSQQPEQPPQQQHQKQQLDNGPLPLEQQQQTDIQQKQLHKQKHVEFKDTELIQNTPPTTPTPPPKTPSTTPTPPPTTSTTPPPSPISSFPPIPPKPSPTPQYLENPKPHPKTPPPIAAKPSKPIRSFSPHLYPHNFPFKMFPPSFDQPQQSPRMTSRLLKEKFLFSPPTTNTTITSQFVNVHHIRFPPPLNHRATPPPNNAQATLPSTTTPLPPTQLPSSSE